MVHFIPQTKHTLTDLEQLQQLSKKLDQKIRHWRL